MTCDAALPEPVMPSDSFASFSASWIELSGQAFKGALDGFDLLADECEHLGKAHAPAVRHHGTGKAWLDAAARRTFTPAHFSRARLFQLSVLQALPCTPSVQILLVDLFERRAGVDQCLDGRHAALVGRAMQGGLAQQRTRTTRSSIAIILEELVEKT